MSTITALPPLDTEEALWKFLQPFLLGLNGMLIPLKLPNAFIRIDQRPLRSETEEDALTPFGSHWLLEISCPATRTTKCVEEAERCANIAARGAPIESFNTIPDAPTTCSRPTMDRWPAPQWVVTVSVPTMTTLAKTIMEMIAILLEGHHRQIIVK